MKKYYFNFVTRRYIISAKSPVDGICRLITTNNIPVSKSWVIYFSERGFRDQFNEDAETRAFTGSYILEELKKWKRTT